MYSLRFGELTIMNASWSVLVFIVTPVLGYLSSMNG